MSDGSSNRHSDGEPPITEAIVERGRDAEAPRRLPPTRLGIPLGITLGTAALVAVGLYMHRRAQSRENHVAVASAPKPVSAVAATATTFRRSHRYVATVEPWVSAKVGPQLVAAYVDTVLFRPGAAVKKGDVLATLDCRNTSAEAQAVAMAARALEAREKALASESARLRNMLDGGFVSANESEKKEAETASAQADILAQKAKLLGSSLEVSDCVLKSPFAGEIAERYMDPGAYARPGSALLSVVDRSTVRIVADVPEVDFASVPPDTAVAIHYLALGTTGKAVIARRVPSADAATRTVRIELDVPDPKRTIPVGTTAELTLDYGETIMAAAIPLAGATVRGERATVFVVDGGIAKKRIVKVLGETGGTLYVEPELAKLTVVTEGKALLSDGDKVTPSLATPMPSSSAEHGK